MRLDVSQALSSPGQEVPFTLKAPLAPVEWNGDTLVFPHGVDIQGKAAAVGEKVMVYGQVSTALKAPCAACLGEANLWIKAKVETLFAREPDPDDLEMAAFEGHEVDLSDAVLGAIFAEMPMRILCQADCLGLCPRCGANRNQTPCSCQKNADQKPFSALASLLSQDEEV